MTSRRLLLAPVALLASLGLLACGGDDDTATDDGDTPAAVDGSSDGDSSDGGSPDLDLGPDELTIEQGDDSVTMGASLPDDFPDSVYLPADFSILQVQERNIAASLGWIVLGSVSDAPDVVEAELLDHYGDPDERTDAGAIVMRYEDDGGYEIKFTLQENADGDTTTTVSVVER